MVTLSLVASLAVDTVVVAVLAWVMWQAAEDRSPPNATAFAAVVGGLLLWAILSLVSEFPHDWSVVGNLAGVGQVVPIVFVPGLWLVYVLGYTGRGTNLTRPRIVLFVVLALPLVGAAAALDGDPSREAIQRSLASLVGTELLMLFVIYVYAAVVFLRYGWDHGRVSKGQLGTQLGAVSAPYILGAWRDGNVILDGVTSGLLIAGLLLAISIRRYPVLTGFPKADYVARSRIVEALQEAVVVVDWDDRILDANETVESLVDQSIREMTGAPIASVLDGITARDLSYGTADTVTLQTTKGRRRFQYTVSAVGFDGASDSDPVARAIVLRDITDERTREQRVSVLNRVLRHNVRNKLDVVLAHADHVEDEDHRQAIQESVSDLASVSQKARDAEAVMTDTSGAVSPVNLVAVAKGVAASVLKEYPESNIIVSAPEQLHIESHQTVIRRLIAELVENGVVHSDAPARVEIHVGTTSDGTPRLCISDHGSGIPDRERDLLSGSGETQLDHGLGVGLWFVNWAVDQLGADLEFERADTSGTTVVVRFHGTDPIDR